MQTFMGGEIGPGLLTANGTHISMVPSQPECLNLVVGSGLSKWMVHIFPVFPMSTLTSSHCPEKSMLIKLVILSWPHM